MTDTDVRSFRDSPALASERLQVMDVLRGFAVMAIFVVNIKGMVMPFGYYFNAELWGTDISRHISYLQQYIIDDKWRTIFSAMFGAGIMLISEKSEARGANSRRRLVLRNFWLMIFGAIHMIGIWMGDILFLYGLTGMLAMLFRNMPLKKLVLWGTLILILGVVWTSGMMLMAAFSDEMLAKMGGMMWGTDPEVLREEIEVFSGGWVDQTIYRAQQAVFMWGFMILGGMVAVTLGLMLMGMILFKAGMLKGQWALGTTLTLAVIFLAGSYALDYVQIQYIASQNNDFGAKSLMAPLVQIDGLMGAFGYACLIVSLVKMGINFFPVAAVGRMAFTNYIACSLIGTTYAGGYGFGNFGSATQPELMTIVGVTFVAMLIWSPLWLSVFRFGPLEWLWRSLTYGRLQPILK